MQTHSEAFFAAAAQICSRIPHSQIETLVADLASLRAANGRLFLIGVGGSAGNCSHAVNDFRKLCGIEAYSPVDNVSELTARANDEGWETIFSTWLMVSRFRASDALFVLSVGGGDAERNVSVNIIRAVEFAKAAGARVFGIVGKPDGYTALNGDTVVVIPQVNPSWITPLSEAFQAVVWHAIVSNPALQTNRTKW